MAKAGRKLLYDEPMLGYNVKLNPTQARKARRIGNGNMADGVRKSLNDAPWPLINQAENIKSQIKKSS